MVLPVSGQEAPLVYIQWIFQQVSNNTETAANEFISLADYLQYLDQQDQLENGERDQLKEQALERYADLKEEFKQNCKDVHEYLVDWQKEEPVLIVEQGIKKGPKNADWGYWVLEGTRSNERSTLYFMLIPVGSKWKIADGFYEGGIPR